MDLVRKHLATILKIWGRHRVSRVAAALAFYAIFALAPATFLVLLVARTVAGPERVLKVIEGEVSPLIGNKGTQGIDQLVRASQHQAHTLPLALAALVFIIAAVAILMQVQEALDDVWGIAEAQRGGLKGVVLLRLHVLLIVLAIALLAVIALFTGLMLGRAAGFGVNVVALFVFLVVAYRVLPNEDVQWKNCAIGAAVTTLVLFAGEASLSFYIRHFHPETAYGKAGSFILILLWVYYSAQLFLFGAVLTHVLEKKT